MLRPVRLLLIALLSLATTFALAQAPQRIRGTITSIDDHTIGIKTREGKDMTFKLSDKLGVAVAKAIKFEDIKQGDYVGSAAMPGADGLTALEVHYLPPTVQAGHTPWDLQPGSTMTNAHVAKVEKTAKGGELVLEYKGGSQKIMVPPGTPLVRAVPGEKGDLKVGEYVFLVAQGDTALRIQVSKDGVKPPQ